MTLALEPASLGRLDLRNRIVRSATAERLSEPETGAPLPALADQYTALARGGVGLIVTGHTYVHRLGRANPWMASIADDDVIPAWRDTIRPAQQLGARVVLQVNHAGSGADPAAVTQPLSPSGVPTLDGATPRAMDDAEVRAAVDAFGQAARRAREAGFDGVQLHAAHGYCASQFLAPRTNRRDDEWGGDPARRRAFLLAMVAAARQQVGEDYPVWIKLGVAGDEASGLRPDEGAEAAQACARAGVDCIEISHGLGVPPEADDSQEGEYLPLARATRSRVGPDYPLALVSGFSSLSAMEAVLRDGLVQLVSLCRPFIAQPDLVRRFEADPGYVAACTRCNLCRPTPPETSIECRNNDVLALR